MELPTSDPSVLKFKQIFEEKLREYASTHHQVSCRQPWTNERILDVISKVKNARMSKTNTERKSSMAYYWLSKYDFMTTGNEEYLIFKRKGPEDSVIRIIPREEYFGILYTVHESCGHGGRDKMVHSLKSQYYITKKAIELFVSLCPKCNIRRNAPRKTIVTRPVVPEDFNVRGHVDLVNFQSCPDGEYKWLLSYQDNATKFLNLRPLKTNMATEVAMELLKIFLVFGPPSDLNSDCGREFTAKVIEELVAMWPDCKIVVSSLKRPQIRNKQDVKNMIRSWMADNNATNWSVGCYFCQYKKNTSHHQIIDMTPYKALLGSDPKAGLDVTTVPSELWVEIKMEDPLQNVKIEPCDDDDMY